VNPRESDEHRAETDKPHRSQTGLASAPGPSAATTDAISLQSGLFLPSELFIPTDPCLPPGLI
jgi:hypothetical protein